MKNSKLKYDDVDGTPLFHLWRNIFNILRLRETDLGELVDEYLSVPGNENVETPKAWNTTKHRITKQLEEPNLTWKNFYRAIKICRFVRGTVIFRGYLPNKSVPIEASVSFLINNKAKPGSMPIELPTDLFFHSAAHRYSFILTNMDGKQRNEQLGVKDSHYDNKSEAKAWRDDIVDILINGNIPKPLKNNAISIINDLYAVMIDDNSNWETK